MHGRRDVTTTAAPRLAGPAWRRRVACQRRAVVGNPLDRRWAPNQRRVCADVLHVAGAVAVVGIVWRNEVDPRVVRRHVGRRRRVAALHVQRGGQRVPRHKAAVVRRLMQQRGVVDGAPGHHHVQQQLEAVHVAGRKHFDAPAQLVGVALAQLRILAVLAQHRAAQHLVQRRVETDARRHHVHKQVRRHAQHGVLLRRVVLHAVVGAHSTGQLVPRLCAVEARAVGQHQPVRLGPRQPARLVVGPALGRSHAAGHALRAKQRPQRHVEDARQVQVLLDKRELAAWRQVRLVHVLLDGRVGGLAQCRRAKQLAEQRVA